MDSELMAKRIKEMRLKHDMTMTELGNIVGVQKSAVNKWEKGVVENIKRSTIEKLATVFGCSPVWLMGMEDDVPEFEEEHVELIELYSRLTKEEKQTIMNLLRSLVAGHRE